MVERRSRNTKKASKQPSGAHYVGYVDDEESIESIMKKFEEVENMKQQHFLPEPSNNFPDPSASSPSPSFSQENFSHEQLEEIFKRTSMFSVKSLSSIHEVVGLEEDDDIRFLCDEEYFSDDSLVDEFDESDCWAEFDERTSHQSNRKSLGLKKIRRAGYDKNNLIQRYREIQVSRTDRFGNTFTIKQRRKQIDPSIPFYTKIPPTPLSVSWAFRISNLPSVPCTPLSSHLECKDILKLDIKKTIGVGFNCILLDPPLESCTDLNKKPYRFNASSLVKLKIDNEIIPQGFIMIWVPKSSIPEVEKIMNGWGFTYVENICWTQKSLNNTFLEEKSLYFNSCKKTLLIYRKIHCKAELRHQRNPDVIFDFKKPIPLKYRQIMEKEYIPEEKPAMIYEIIETLLPNTKGPYPCEEIHQRSKLLELWSYPKKSRPGWVTVSSQVSI